MPIDDAMAARRCRTAAGQLGRSGPHEWERIVSTDESRNELADVIVRGFNSHAMGGGDYSLSHYLADLVLSSTWLDTVLEGERARARTEIIVTDEMVERAAQATFDEPWRYAGGEYSWAEMVEEDPSRADIWREDARCVLTAALSQTAPHTNGGE